jgi:hypothetical protein
MYVAVVRWTGSHAASWPTGDQPYQGRLWPSRVIKNRPWGRQRAIATEATRMGTRSEAAKSHEGAPEVLAS